MAEDKEKNRKYYEDLYAKGDFSMVSAINFSSLQRRVKAGQFV